MRIWKIYTCICVVGFGTTALNVPDKPRQTEVTRVAAEYFKKEAVSFWEYTKTLKTVVSQIKETDAASVVKARIALKNCRLHFKRISFFLDYFFQSESLSFNAPPKYEVDEPFMEYQHPKGLQFIESLLYENKPISNKAALIDQAELVERSAADLPALLFNFNCTGSQLLESLQLELIRIMTLYITGYDAPYLKSGIEESRQSLLAFTFILKPFVDEGTQSDSTNFYLNKCISYLQSSTGFDSFNRLEFLTRYALPLQENINKLAREKRLLPYAAGALNKDALNLFSADALNKKAFPHADEQTGGPIIELGKQLFFDKDLSSDQTRSCSSCHSPSSYFTDGLARNKSLDNKHILPRNTMGLMYACYQYAQFWDGRAKSLEDQIKIVLANKDEMGCDDSVITLRIKARNQYTAYFKYIWPGDTNAVSNIHIINAIASYLRTLTPLNSAFDKYMQGNRNALTPDQKKGFNLFMGKAQCGTCHFAPIFNGLTPPLYNKTEYEVLGTPANDNFQAPAPDPDSGRKSFFNIPFYKGAFKTPTVRNAAMTAPYMHNGCFKNLDKLVEFYDKGGGNGLRLDIPEQTLSSTALHLSATEKSQIVSFINALTDEKP